MEQFLQINLGQIIQVVIILVGGVLALQTMKNEIRYQGDRLVKVEEKIEDLQKVVVQIARQDERLTAMDQRMLQQGKRLDQVANKISKYGKNSEETDQ